MKTELRSAFVYDIKKDAWIFHLEIPCDDHDGKQFKNSKEEHDYYLKKAKQLFLTFEKKE